MIIIAIAIAGSACGCRSSSSGSQTKEDRFSEAQKRIVLMNALEAQYGSKIRKDPFYVTLGEFNAQMQHLHAELKVLGYDAVWDDKSAFRLKKRNKSTPQRGDGHGVRRKQ